MKKIVALLFLYSICSFAQEVSPYYPAKYVGENPSDFSSQLTYFDSNFIVNKVSDFIYYRMAMKLESSDDSKLLYNGGELTYHYADMFSSGRLSIKYYIGKVNDVYTVKSVKITGDSERLITFFVEFWKTTINFKEPSGKSDVSLLTGQDVVKLFFNKGKPYITVTNGTYKTIEEFNLKFNQLLASKNN